MTDAEIDDLKGELRLAIYDAVRRPMEGTDALPGLNKIVNTVEGLIEAKVIQALVKNRVIIVRDAMD